MSAKGCKVGVELPPGWGHRREDVLEPAPEFFMDHCEALKAANVVVCAHDEWFGVMVTKRGAPAWTRELARFCWN